MNLVYFCKSQIPGIEANSIHVMKMCEAFMQEGQDTTLLAPRLHGQRLEKDFEKIRDMYGIPFTFCLKYLWSMPLLYGHDFCFRAALWAKMKSVDLVYARYLGAAAWSSVFGIPTMYEAHVPPQDNTALFYFRKLICGTGFQKLVVISSALKKIFMERFKIQEEKICVAHDGVDLERFEKMPNVLEARQKLGLSAQSFTVGYAGHLYPGRGMERLEFLAKTFPAFQFLAMGGTDLDLQRFKNRLKENNISNLRCFGFVPNARLPLYLAACDVLLMPYQKKVGLKSGGDTSAWMSPMKMFESMAAGKLILSSDLPVLREVLNEKNAVLIDPENEDAWGQALEHAAQNPFWRQELARQAKKDVLPYSWRRRVQKVLGN